MEVNRAKIKTEKICEKIIDDFSKHANGNKKICDSVLLVHSDKMNIHLKTVVGKISGEKAHPDMPYHFASIGKTITSIIIAMLYEKGRIDFNDLAEKYISPAILRGLLTHKGTDYSKSVQISHLLNHTSGIADYYTDKPDKGIRLLDSMLNEPERFWTPHNTINWVKENLKPHFAPGNGFHYSDTNYQILGLIIENITGKPLHETMSELIFDKLEMNNTYQIFYSKPRIESPYPVASLISNNLNLIECKSISMSWASGGAVSTSEDMLKFLNAIVKNELIRRETFEKMQDWARFGPGIKYGYGLMKFNFLLMPKKYEIWGNSGSIGAVMYYNPAMDVSIIGSFNKLNYQAPPIFFIIKVLRRLNKLIG